MDEKWSLSTPALRVCDAPSAPILQLRLRHVAPEMLRVLGAVIGVELPTAFNTATGTSTRAIWTAPGCWVIIGGLASPADIETACQGATVLCLDIGASRYAIDVSGAAAPDLLAKGCTLDLHPRAFPPGRTALTVFAQVPVLIDQPGPVFRLSFDATQKRYVRDWFEDAVIEFKEFRL